MVNSLTPQVLDLRIYRAAFVLPLLAVIVVAFSLAPRPRPIATTLAPDAFDGPATNRLLGVLARDFPDRRPGSAGDLGLAQRVRASMIAAGFRVRTRDVAGATIDGEQTVRTVLATRPGASSRQIVVLAHRDAAGPGAQADLGATATLMAIASVFAGRTTRRTLTLVSTSGGSGGFAGAAGAAQALGSQVDAVIVLGDVAAAGVRKRFVVPWSLSRGVAPLRLQRTVEMAVREETGTGSGGTRALSQILRLAFPLTISEQGVLGQAGLPAVLLGPGGEHGSSARAATSAARLEGFGRALLRSLTALDAGPDVRPAGPQSVVVTKNQVLPQWAIRLLAGALLAPVVLAALDGLFRVRRAREPVGRWLLWVTAGALPLLLGAGMLMALRVTGLLSPVPGAPVRPGVLDVQWGAVAAVAAMLALGWLVARPAVVRRLFGADARRGVGGAGSSAAVGLATTLAVLAIWVVNPFAALFLVPAAHLWLLAAATELRVARLIRVVFVLLGMAPLVLAGVAYAVTLGAGPVDAGWMVALLVAGGVVGPFSLLLWSLVGGCAVAALLVASRVTSSKPTRGPRIGGSPTVRGPLSYAGPGSLGGTDSALRR